MKKVLSKLRIKVFIYKLRLEVLLSKITAPFKIMVACIQRYLLLRKIDNESQDNWEKHVKRRELANQDEFNLRRQRFFTLKSKLICAFFRATMSANFYAMSQDPSNKDDDEFLSKMDDYREDFKREKSELVELLQKFNEYNEITFDKDIKAEIIAWEFEDCKTIEEVNNRTHKFADYMQTLDLKQ